MRQMRVISDELMNGRPQLACLRRHAASGQGRLPSRPRPSLLLISFWRQGETRGFQSLFCICNKPTRTSTPSRGLFHVVVECPELVSACSRCCYDCTYSSDSVTQPALDYTTYLPTPFLVQFIRGTLDCYLPREQLEKSCRWSEESGHSTDLDAITRPGTLRSDGCDCSSLLTDNPPLFGVCPIQQVFCRAINDVLHTSLSRARFIHAAYIYINQEARLKYPRPPPSGVIPSSQARIRVCHFEHAE
jgi:hypothetical protein